MTARPYDSIWEHLREELSLLDLALEHAIENFSRPARPPELEQFGGLVLTEAEVLDVLRAGSDGSSLPSSRDRAGLKRRRQALEDRKRATREENRYLPFLYLSEVLRLESFEQRVLILALAPEIELKYEKAFAYLQDDVTRKLPTVDLARALFCDDEDERWSALESFNSSSAWRRFEMLHLLEVDGPQPLLSRRLKLDDRITHFLLGSQALDATVCRWAHLVEDPTPQLAAAPETPLAELRRLLDGHFADAADGKGQGLVIHLSGRYGSGRRSLAEAASAHLSLPLVWLDMRKILASEALYANVRRVLREALLQPAAIGVLNFNDLITKDVAIGQGPELLIDAIETFSRLTFLVGEEPWTAIDLFSEQRLFSLHCAPPDYDGRISLWHEALNGTVRVEATDTIELASKFRFTPGQIHDAVADARTHMLAHGGTSDLGDVRNLHDACRRQASPNLGELARKIDPVFTWRDIVLPQSELGQLKEISSHVRHSRTVMGVWGFERRFPLGRAVTALFAGGSGCGKTMAAEILAADLQLDLFKIDLSGVVSKYIGETEKNLNRIFKEAQNSNAILFFDEADALFGKRSEVKDSHDRYANIEIAYLLQRMEEYDGIVILATNMKKNLDEAFVRRMRFIVDFPFPEVADREQIWHRIFPSEAPLAEDVDFSYLARKLKVTGGNIKNISLRAAYHAVERGSERIDMACLIQAAKRELDKVGKLYTEAEFGARGRSQTVAPRLEPDPGEAVLAR